MDRAMGPAAEEGSISGTAVEPSSWKNSPGMEFAAAGVLFVCSAVLVAPLLWSQYSKPLPFVTAFCRVSQYVVPDLRGRFPTENESR